VLGALSKITPERVMAAGEGGNTVIALSGYDKDSSEPFILVDMINGAWGGRSSKDGIEGVTNPSQNMSNMPIETLEARYPILMEEYGFRNDSGGAGRYRGGLGLVRQYRVLARNVVAQVRSDRADHPPYGLFGGQAGAPSRNVLNPATTAQAVPSKFTMELGEGVVIRHEQAGGGGYGNPLQRDIDLIERDLRDGKVSAAHAQRHHGVILDGKGSIDRDATLRKRRELAA
jgi:N-methylhydantoinase B